ncbi:hypothetical protein M0802_005929 [Mischocyttarus mexicanus]|nr:hypothetical protein M0802_005929 [Mischocyttarus mexicanus]
MSAECPSCGEITNKSHLRLVTDSCGHTKCRICLLYEEQGCKICNNILQTDESIVEMRDNYMDTTDSKQNFHEFTTININDEKNSIEIYIPKTEPCDINSDVQMHVNNDNVFNDDSNSIATEVNKSELKSVELPSLEPPKDKKHVKSSNRSHISVIPGNPVKYKCNPCGKIFRNKKSRGYHDACISGVKPYQCTFCDKGFVKRSHFEYHERVHSGYKPFKCNICEKAFPQQNKLNRHMQSHNSDKQFVCSKCNKKYSKQEDLKIHSSIHDKSDAYTCFICKKSFYILINLKRHMKTHKSERPYTCDQCSKSFKVKSLLIRHKKTHQKDRPFSCDICNRVFLSKSELRRHITIHSEDKPYSCEYCQTVFRRKDNLHRHVRHHHTETSVDKINDSLDITKNMNDKSILKSKQTNTKHKQKEKQKQELTDVKLKSSNKIAIDVAANSHNQINSRLDSMGNITSVIKTTTELSNAVPVINGPIYVRKTEEKTENNEKIFMYTKPIPLAEAIDINRRIEEKLYQDPYHNFVVNDYTDMKRPFVLTNTNPITNPCKRCNFSNLNDLSSESTTESETTFTYQTAESSNVKLEKDLIIEDKIFKDKSIIYDDLKKDEMATFEKTNEAVDLKDCNLYKRKRCISLTKLITYYSYYDDLPWNFDPPVHNKITYLHN